MLIDNEAIKLLTPLYSDKNRHYHDINHIYYLFYRLNKEYPNLPYSVMTPLRYIIWFHDAIYSPFPDNHNEELSAELYNRHFKEHLLDIHGYDVKEEIVQGILATKYHLLNKEQLKERFNGQSIADSTYVMLDLDLSSFSESVDMVDFNSNNVLKEYECLGLSNKELIKNRIAFLEKLLDKDEIYYTTAMKKYEKVARERIANIISYSRSYI